MKEAKYQSQQCIGGSESDYWRSPLIDELEKIAPKNEIEIPLDEIIEEERKKHNYSKKQLEDFREAFLADKDSITTKAVKNLIRKEEVKKGVPKKWK